ncbi:MAG: phosphatidylglycerophosphatase A [Ignavibacteria bacterium]
MRLIKAKKVVDPDAKVDLFSKIFSSFFLTGYFPVASGTVGSLAALIIFCFSIFYSPVVLFLLIAFCFVTGIFTSKNVMKRYGDDPSVVVIDESVGMWLTVLIFILLSGSVPSLFYLGISFLAFRFFDITKLQPAKYFDGLNSGFGIMMDDVVAGVYAGITVYLIWLSKLDFRF